jgi:hypothetical protein
MMMMMVGLGIEKGREGGAAVFSKQGEREIIK